jgi:cytolysin-activating lysine-acyltransferase
MSRDLSPQDESKATMYGPWPQESAGTRASPGERPESLSRANARQTLYATRFANAVGVLMRDPNFRNIRLADLQWLVIPPLMAGQCRIAHAGAPKLASNPGEENRMIPVSVALWASVSDEIDARLTLSLDKPVILTQGEWKSGDNLWLMVIAGDPRATPTFLEQLENREFKGKNVKVRARASNGQTEILSLAAFRARKTSEFAGSELKH